MSTESVGSCVGGGAAAPTLPLPLPLPLRNSPSPFREGQKFSPNTPDKSHKKRRTICHHCKQEGHWARECPNKSMESPGPSPGKALFPKCPPNYPELLCKNCQQPCVVRTSRTATNPDRDFYTCPRGQACNMFQWCNKVDKIQSQRVNSPGKPIHQCGAAVSQNPICNCTAGPCRIETTQRGEWKGRKYFTCYLKLGQGACDHFEWCDGLGDDGERKKNLNCNPTMTEEQNNTGMNNHGEILKNKDGITSEEMDLVAFSPPPPTTPRADHKTDHADLGSSLIKRPNLLKGCHSKRKCIEEQVSERIASPSLNCYLNEGCSNTASPGLNRYLNGEPKTLEPNRETVGTLVSESPPPLEHSQMKRLSLAEGNSIKHEECLVCGEVEHGIDDCDVLAQLVASPSLNCYLNEGPSNATSPGLNRYLNEEPKTLGPNRETVGTLVLESPQHPQMKRLSLAEGSSTTHEECLVCGGVGHGIDDCDVLAQLVASPYLNCYLNEGPSNATSPGLNRYLNEEPKTPGPNKETVGTLVVESPQVTLQHPQMKSLSLAEGNSTKHEECLVCGGVGHGIDACDVLVQLAAS